MSDFIFPKGAHFKFRGGNSYEHVVLASLGDLRAVSSAKECGLPDWQNNFGGWYTLHELAKHEAFIVSPAQERVTEDKTKENGVEDPGHHIYGVGPDGNKVLLAKFFGVSPSGKTLQHLMEDYQAKQAKPATDPVGKLDAESVRTSTKAMAIYEEAKRVQAYFNQEIETNKEFPEVVVHLTHQRDLWVQGLHEEARKLNGLDGKPESDGVV